MKKAITILYAVLIIVNIIFWGFIVPDLYGTQNPIMDNTTEPTLSTVPIETIYSTEPTPTEDTVPYTTAPTEKEFIKDYSVEYSYGERVTPSVEINTYNGIKNNTDDIDTDEYKYLGKYTVTGYTPTCKHCCSSGKGITASGVQAIPGYTVATNKSIPFGTTLYIEGYGYYVVEDRGVGSNHVDIAANTHEECYALTDTEVNVYIVPYIIEVVNDENVH